MSDIPQLSRIHHLALTVTDLDASIAWYERIFGFKQVLEEPHEGGTGIIMTEPRSDLWLALHRHDANESEPFAETRTGLDHIGFQVADLAALHAWRDHFAAHGVPQSAITQKPEAGVAVLVFRDPDNIQLELFTQLS